MTLTRSLSLWVYAARMRLSLRSATVLLHFAGIRHACYGVSVSEARQHIVDRLLYATIWPV